MMESLSNLADGLLLGAVVGLPSGVLAGRLGWTIWQGAGLATALIGFVWLVVWVV